MHKYLITGSSGFVSRYFLEHLAAVEPGARVLGLDIEIRNVPGNTPDKLSIRHEAVDLLDGEKLYGFISDFKPDYILHLAAASSVAYSWKEPALSFKNNTNIFLSLLESVRKTEIPARILSVGSSEVYGNSAIKMLPIGETAPLDPLSPYAIARVAQEMLSKLYVDDFNMDIIMTRSFNHIGPGQSETFVVSSFARQITELKKKGLPGGRISAGDLSIVRDFLDVRDVVRAYHMLFMKGKKGEIYNVCSGKGTALNTLIQSMSDISGIKLNIETDKSLIRLSDNKVMIGSNEKIIKELGWKPDISIEDSLKDIIEYWMQKGGIQ